MNGRESRTPIRGARVSRRRWVWGATALATAGSFSFRTQASAGKLRVDVPNHAVGAVAAAVGGPRILVRVVPTLGPLDLTIASHPVKIGARILLKGHKDIAQGRFLDDARNAPKLGANLRDAFTQHDRDGATTYENNHRAWSRPLAYKIIAWTRQLQASSVHGQRMPDPYGRAALLEWAGATVDPRGPDRCPPALARAPLGPQTATTAAYENYIQLLVDALR